MPNSENRDSFKISPWFYVVPSVMLLLAPPIDWPYGYYQLLRIVVCIFSGLLASAYHGQAKKTWMVCFIIAAVLFNPLIPIHLKRDAWTVIDFLAAGIFLLALAISRKKPGDQGTESGK